MGCDYRNVAVKIWPLGTPIKDTRNESARS